jgi:hypothetical protein
VALKQCRDVNNDPKTRLDDFMMQSWVPQPHQMLPENEPGTSTWLLKQIEALR